MPELRTRRLVLRGWRDADLDTFASLNADPAVMEHFPSTLDRASSNALAVRIAANLAADGFGFWAVEIPGVTGFAGFCGIAPVRFGAEFTPAVEAGWRLDRARWGKGYAAESAQAAIDYGFATAGLDEIVSFTVPQNLRSRALMERLGFVHDPAGDFDHPFLAGSDKYERHVLYRLPRAGSNASRS